MASVNFLYRSTRNEANLNLRLLFRYNGKDEVVGGKTKIFVTKDYYNNWHDKKRISDIAIINKQSEVKAEENKIRLFLLESFNKERSPSLINKDWLKNQLDHYYNPNRYESDVPEDLVSFIDYYIRVHPKLKKDREKKFITIRNKMQRFQNSIDKTIYISNINFSFLNEFDKYYDDECYKQTTKHRELGTIKMFCRFAKKKGIQLHNEFDDVKVSKGESFSIYLTFDELDKIESKIFKDEALEAAKDWLLISSYTGQRISDFSRFSKDMVRVEDGVKFLELTQQKKPNSDAPPKRIAIPLPLDGKVQSILDKRNGDFPKQFTDQKYNKLVKIVCEEAEINEIVEGSKSVNIAPEGKKAVYRDVVGFYPKYELVTSHIGRISFGSNYYGKIPDAYLRSITGHSTEKVFLQSYMKKGSTLMAKETLKFMK